MKGDQAWVGRRCITYNIGKTSFTDEKRWCILMLHGLVHRYVFRIRKYRFKNIRSLEKCPECDISGNNACTLITYTLMFHIIKFQQLCNKKYKATWLNFFVNLNAKTIKIVRAHLCKFSVTKSTLTWLAIQLHAVRKPTII